MFKTIYTLRSRTKGTLEDNIYPQEFDTFEDAYKKMVGLYIESVTSDLPSVYWGIWQTSISEYDGKENSMTQAVWS